MTRYVGMDLHRRRSVIVVLEADGTELWTTRIDTDPLALGVEIEKAGPAPEVVREATWGWYWAADVITEAGGRVHLAHPLGIAGYENRRVKNDQIDARLLADLLRMGRLPEAWIAPGTVRQQRELVRYRRKLSQLRAGLKSQVHAVLAKKACCHRSTTYGDPAARPGWTKPQWETPTKPGSGPYAGSSRPMTARSTSSMPASLKSSKGHPGNEAIQVIHGVGPG